MTDKELDSIHQLLSSPHTALVGFKLAENYGYDEVDIIEKLFDCIGVKHYLYDEIKTMTLGKWSFAKNTHNLIARYRCGSDSANYINWSVSKSNTIETFIKYLKE